MGTMTTAPTERADPQTLLLQLLDPVNRADPYPVCAELRGNGPLVLPGSDFVLFSSYRDCDEVLRHPSSSSDHLKSTAAQQMLAADPSLRKGTPPSFLFLDPPDHTRLRKLVSKAFAPKVVNALQPEISMNRPGGDAAAAPRWGGAALLRPGVLAFTGSIGSTDVHAHHAVQIITATTAFTVLDERGARHRGLKVVVPADAPHRIEVGAQEGAVVFLEPESAPGRAAHSRALGSGWIVTPVLTFTRRRALAAVVDELIAHFTPATGDYGTAVRHPAVDDALRLLPDLVAAGPVSGTELAALVGLSASRLTHLFTEQVGIPLRRYVLWSRLRAAINRVQAGDDLTGAAHGAGFADSAHLTRTTREMFGLPPSVLSRHVSWELDGEG